MKNNTKLIVAAAIGGAGYLVYKNWDKISNMFKKKDATTDEGEGAGSETKDTPTNTGKTYSAYQLKVMKLQGVVGASVDGAVGKNTNGAVKAYFPNSYAKLGDVTPANIDAYLALGTKKETIDTTLADIKARGQAVWAAMSSKNGVIRQDGNVRAVEYDGIDKTYKDTSGIFKIKKGTVIVKSRAKLLNSGFIVYVPFVYNQDGSNHGERQVRIDPREINVV